MLNVDWSTRCTLVCMLCAKYEIQHLARGTLISHSLPPDLPECAHDAIHPLYHVYYMNVCALLIWAFPALLLVCCAQSKIWYAYFTFKFTSPSPASLICAHALLAHARRCHGVIACCVSYLGAALGCFGRRAQRPKTRVTHIPVPRPRWLLTRLRPY